MLIEIQADADLPDTVRVKDTHGNLNTQELIYEDVPPRCMQCKCFSHKVEQCLKLTHFRETWIIKNKDTPSHAIPTVQQRRNGKNDTTEIEIVIIIRKQFKSSCYG